MARDLHARSPVRRLPALVLSIALIATLAMATSGAAAPSKPADRGARKGKSFRAGLSQKARVNQRCRRRGLAPRPRRARSGRRRLRLGCVRARPSTGSPVPLYWGAWIGDQLTGDQAPWDMSAVSTFEGLAGKSLSIVHFSSPFYNCASTCYEYRFPTEPMDSIREHGAIPFFSWASQSIPSTTSEPDFQLADVLAGTYDSYIHDFATAARNWGHPFFLRFNWEMNGNWFPWSESANGNGPDESVAVWRHVHDIFASAGATNVTWVWCPNVDPEDRFQDLGSLYPGDSYVDWTCLDGYNWGLNRSKQSGWMSFDRVYRSTYREITEQIAPAKPMIVGEVGSSEQGGSKAAWISEALSKVTTDYTQIRGFLYFEKFDDGMDWPIETSASATEAFAAGIQAPYYRTNSYADLSASPIPPPS